MCGFCVEHRLGWAGLGWVGRLSAGKEQSAASGNPGSFLLFIPLLLLPCAICIFAYIKV